MKQCVNTCHKFIVRVNLLLAVEETMLDCPSILRAVVPTELGNCSRENPSQSQLRYQATLGSDD